MKDRSEDQHVVPTEDQRIVIRLADHSSLTGLINLTGRTVLAMVQESDPHILLYDATDGDGRGYETALVSKHQILWIETPAAAQDEKPAVGDWKKVRFRLTDGHEITAEIDITGFDRPSDYFRAYAGNFYTVYARLDDKKPSQKIFIASAHVVLRELGS